MFEIYDVVIAGAGVSGIAAAVYAKKNGARTLLIERDGYAGGMSTAGFLNTWCGNASSGIYSQITKDLTVIKGRRKIFDPEEIKLYYLDLLTKTGVDLLFHSQICNVTVRNGLIESIDTAEIKNIKGKIYIDSTGNGDLAYLAGIAYEKGRDSDGLMQPVSTMFMVGGVDESKAVYPTFSTHPQYEKLMQNEIAEGRITEPAGHVILIEGIKEGTASVNMTNMIRIDGTNPFDLTKAELHTRSQIKPIIDFLRRCIPGYENCYLYQTAHYVGVRETRRFDGEFKLTEQHIQDNTIFDDWIVSRASYGFGNHNLTGSGSDSGNLKYNGKNYTIPYGCFVAKGLGNLYLNGRCISGTHMAHGSYRIMPICFAMGQGIGTAAAISISENIPIRSVDVKKIQSKLLEQGVEYPITN